MKNLLLPTFLATCTWLAAPAVLAQPAAQPAAKKAAASKPKPKPKAVVRKTEVRSTTQQMAALSMAPEVALESMELAIAEHVHTGVLRCELGASVTLTNDP